MKLGFIGMGNMATALCRGFIASNGIKGEDILAFAPNREKLERHANEIGFKCAASSVEVTDGSDVIIMACKPYQIDDVLSEVKDHLKGKALVSVAAGWNYDKYMEYVDSDVRVQFVMPNTPAMVGEGVLLFEDKNSLNDSEREEIMKLFSSTGIVVEMPSKLMGIGGAITGCGPAFADMYIEAYADAAVKYGIPRKEAYTLVSQTLLGSAKLQLETNEHPGVLKDNVCSPSGTTICGVAALEKAGFRSACIESIEAIMNKNY